VKLHCRFNPEGHQAGKNRKLSPIECIENMCCENCSVAQLIMNFLKVYTEPEFSPYSQGTPLRPGVGRMNLKKLFHPNALSTLYSSLLYV
jgi:hypothetical protein